MYFYFRWYIFRPTFRWNCGKKFLEICACHAYKFSLTFSLQQDNLSFPLICPDWNADEEILLLEVLLLSCKLNFLKFSFYIFSYLILLLPHESA